ncbi:ankyrin repeat domain-containing protein 54-like [Tubulanus polymorphus]|uniref:ankyrin repeat domain-containing protein 54-like n=1 Tax=Tubulanus polymorphus TaxID=672921 RepID=UPI003DA1DE9B
MEKSVAGCSSTSRGPWTENHCSSSESEEGEYCVENEEKKALTLGVFPIKWTSNVEYLPPISYENLNPVPAPSFNYESHEHVKSFVTKMRTGVLHRRQRMRNLCNRSAVARSILDPKKLRFAASNDDYDKVVNLLIAGVDPCIKDDRHRTPLHIAAAKGYDRIVKVLLDYGADANQKDMIGNTPLHLAVCSNHINVVTTLLKSGTNARMIDNSGRTPLHLAQSRLRILHDEPGYYTPSKLREECFRLVDMIKQYLIALGTEESVDELSGLCEKMSLATTRSEMDNVNELLSQFTDMNIEKRDKKDQLMPP